MVLFYEVVWTSLQQEENAGAPLERLRSVTREELKEIQESVAEL